MEIDLQIGYLHLTRLMKSHYHFAILISLLNHSLLNTQAQDQDFLECFDV
jgi:hypothetical protein